MAGDALALEERLARLAVTVVRGRRDGAGASGGEESGGHGQQRDETDGES
jgi:hypothetical protein